MIGRNNVRVTFSSPNSPPPLPVKPKSRRIFLVLLVIGVLIPGSFVAWRISIAWKVHARLEALQQAGYPVTMTELEQRYYPSVPSNSNGALYFNQAFAYLSLTNQAERNFFLQTTSKLTASKAISSADKTNIIMLLKRNEAALNLFLASPASNVCRYPLNFPDGYLMLLPHVSKLRDSVNLLNFLADWNTYTNNSDEAVQDIEAALRLSHSLIDEPLLVSQLARMTSVGGTVSCLARIVNRQPLSDHQLAELSAEFERQRTSIATEHALVGELCCTVAFFSMSAKQMATDTSIQSDENTDGNSDYHSDSTLGFQVMKLSGFRDRDLNFYLSVMADYLSAVKLPFPEKLDTSEQIRERASQTAGSHLFVFSSMLLPGVKAAFSREAEIVARLNIAQTALAVERYRLANGNNLPQKLSDLTPAYLPEVPMDPFDGRPLRYKILPKGYLIYSIGQDRKDDGGVNRIPGKMNSPDDITFRVER